MLLNLKIVLLRNKLSQKELAETIGVSESRLSRIVLGRIRPRACERQLIAERLGVRETELFRRRYHKRASGLAQRDS